MRSNPMRQFNSVRELTASDATCTIYPSRSAPSAVCITQMWVSIPHSKTVVRCPGNRFSKEQNTSLPKHENISLSIDGVSGSKLAMSGTVPPNPFAYCVVTTAGILRIPASRISLHIAHQPLFFPHRRQQFLLHIHDDKSALLGLQGAARHLRIVALGWNNRSWKHFSGGHGDSLFLSHRF